MWTDLNYVSTGGWLFNPIRLNYLDVCIFIEILPQKNV